MKNNLLGSIFLGIMAISPLLVFALVGCVLLGGYTSTLPIGRIVIALLICSVILYAIAVGYFLYLVQVDERLDSSDKARWTYILLMFFPVAAIWFWYQFIWRTRDLTVS